MKKLFAKEDKRTELEKEYDDAVRLLKTFTPGSQGYTEQLDVVERISKVLDEQQAREKKFKLSADTAATVACGLLQVAMIIGKEHLGNVTSKAMGLIFKGRVR